MIDAVPVAATSPQGVRDAAEREPRDGFQARWEAFVASRGRGGPWARLRAVRDRLLATDEREYVDDPSVAEAQRRAIHEQLDRANRFGRLYDGLALLLFPLVEQAARRAPGRPVRVLDVGTGHGGAVIELSRRASGRGLACGWTGLDLSCDVVRLAREKAAQSGTSAVFVAGDATGIPAADGAFDVAFTTLSLHHMPPDAVRRVVAEMHRVAGTGLLLADLRRGLGTLAVLSAGLFVLERGRVGLAHDGRISARHAYDADELAFIVGATPAAGYLRRIAVPFLNIWRGCRP